MNTNHLLRFFLFCLVCSLSANAAFAQTIITDDEGRKIVLSPDGSWRYLNPDEVKSETTQEIPLDDEEAGARAMIEKTEAARAKMKQTQEELDQLLRERTALEDQIKRYEDAKDPAFNEMIAIKKRRLQEFGPQEDKIKQQLAREQWYASSLEKLIFVPNKKRERMLAKVEEEYRSNKTELAGLTTLELPAAQETKEIDIPNRNYARYAVEKDVLLNPPPAPCQVVFDDVDEMIGRRRKDIAPAPLIRYTPTPLRGRLPVDDYISIDASMTAAFGGLKVLNLEIRIASPNAQVEFGRLEDGALINFRLLNGDVIKMVNKTMDFGRYDKAKKVYTYRGQFQITAEAEKKLRASELDKLRIVWSTGYEDYPVYEVDFFFNQFKCLEW